MPAASKVTSHPDPPLPGGRERRSLKLKVVAEGIEDLEQPADLQRLDCEVGQGYYFAKPMAAPEMTAFMRSPVAERAA